MTILTIDVNGEELALLEDAAKELRLSVEDGIVEMACQQAEALLGEDEDEDEAEDEAEEEAPRRKRK